KLPHAIKAEAARHDRIAFEMTGEEPEIRVNVELGKDLSLAIFAALLADMGNAVDHEHRRKRKLRIARSKHASVAAFKQVFQGICRFLFRHRLSALSCAALRLSGKFRWPSPMMGELVPARFIALCKACLLVRKAS